MALTNAEIHAFVKATKEATAPATDSTPNTITVTGTASIVDGSYFVRLDGSEQLTPIASSTVGMKTGDRVTVKIASHKATVTGNTTDPSATSGDVADTATDLNNKITEVGNLVADSASIKDLEAANARITQLTADNVIIRDALTADAADISALKAEDVRITGELVSARADIQNLHATKLDADIATATYATIANLDATNADIHNLSATYAAFETATTNTLVANDASIKKLQTDKLDATDADLKYANIDFSNIQMAAVQELFAKSGIIDDLVISNGKITGELVGVTIKGDLIEGGTVVADKLVILGEDGLYYKLNTDGETVESAQTEYNSISGKNILANSITATKIDVDDLVAFNATIGGFHISQNSIFSGAKNSALNTTRGLYMDDTGQMAIGDASNYLRYFKDESGNWKLDISVQSIKMGASSIEDKFQEVDDALEDVRNQTTMSVSLESSNGSVFKNTAIATSLIATIYRGDLTINSIEMLTDIIGDSAHLEWQEKKFTEDEYQDIPQNDPRISSGGFIFIISPGDVLTQTTFKCNVVI